MDRTTLLYVAVSVVAGLVIGYVAVKFFMG